MCRHSAAEMNVSLLQSAKPKKHKKTSLNQCPADNYFAQQNTCLSCDTTNIIVKQPSGTPKRLGDSFLKTLSSKLFQHSLGQ
jgi:hypothetical protein